jgi:hypothetical protein
VPAGLIGPEHDAVHARILDDLQLMAEIGVAAA